MPTLQQELPIRDELSRTQVQQLTENCKKNNIELYNYLRECGYKVSAFCVHTANFYKSSNFSVGLVKAHFKEDNPEL